jgi:hypothetical protein
MTTDHCLRIFRFPRIDGTLFRSQGGLLQQAAECGHVAGYLDNSDSHEQTDF